MYYAFEIDAADVLGVSSGATLREIQDAYRARVKKHHPDVGGEDWAFRAVVRAYELLSHARIRSRIDFEWQVSDTVVEPPPATPPPSGKAPSTPPSDRESSFYRPGVHDKVDNPSKTVDIEVFTVRFEMDGPMNLLVGAKDRNLSSCLHVTWPAPPVHDGDVEPRADPEILKRLIKAFDGIPKRTKALGSWSRSENGRFQGWMSYTTANNAFEAFEMFHRALNDKGLGVRQSTRELFVTRGQR
jgi:curved DNA-binding protein CbpA